MSTLPEQFERAVKEFPTRYREAIRRLLRDVVKDSASTVERTVDIWGMPTKTYDETFCLAAKVVLGAASRFLLSRYGIKDRPPTKKKTKTAEVVDESAVEEGSDDNGHD